MRYDETFAGLSESLRAQQDALHANRGRLARVTATWTTFGNGEILVSKVFEFGIVFVEEPCFTTGMALDDDTQLVSGYFPRATAGVYDWRRDNNGYYTGAFVYFVVDTVTPDALKKITKNVGTNNPLVEPTYTVHHHLRWEGKAIKTLPDYLLDF